MAEPGTDAAGARAWIAGSLAVVVSLTVQVATAPAVEARLIVDQVHVPLFWTLGLAGLHGLAAGLLVWTARPAVAGRPAAVAAVIAACVGVVWFALT